MTGVRRRPRHGVAKILPQHAQMFGRRGPHKIHQQTGPEAPPAFLSPAVAVQPRHLSTEFVAKVPRVQMQQTLVPPLAGRMARHDVLRLGVRPAARAWRRSVVSRSASACATSRPNRREAVVSAPLVIVVGIGPFVEFDNQALVEHPLDRSVQGPGAELHRAVGPRGDVLHDGVAMPILVGEGDQDLKDRGRQRQGRGDSR